jgi:glutaminyl-peptide cyclotransferase
MMSARRSARRIVKRAVGRRVATATWAACGAAVVAAQIHATGLDAQSLSRGATAAVWRHDVVRAYPHDQEAFTQGLVFRDGVLFESTGLNGQSSLRRVDLATGRVARRISVDRRYFAEGLAAWGPNLVQLTWETGVAFVYDRATFALLRTFTYQGEGWGLSDDGRQLVMSDGSSTLRFLDPATFAVTRRVTVLDGARPIDHLNELEVVDGLIFANVWLTDRIAIIDPADGRVVGWLDLANLVPAGASGNAVLNGIAYDSGAKRLFVTGKLWPKLYEIRVHRPS